MMENKTNSIIVNSLAQNRAEEFGLDLYKEFIIPPIFTRIEFKKNIKSKVIIGGRGCGKTMLLRYLSYPTIFSKYKKTITVGDFENIGLYYKAETYILHQLQLRNIDSNEWDAAFEHFITLMLSIDLIKSLECVALSNYPEFDNEMLRVHVIKNLDVFAIEHNGNLIELKSVLTSKIFEFQTWLKNIRKNDSPSFLPIVFLKFLVNYIKTHFYPFEKTNFNIYIDEYENLTSSQQKIVNTWVKESENPIVFNLAMKRNSFKTKETVGSESLSDIHDYRIYDLEEGFVDPIDFQVFASEVILYRLKKENPRLFPEFDMDMVKDVTMLNTRETKIYKDKILSITQEIFPTRTHKELANDTLLDSKLYSKIIENIDKTLNYRKSKYKAEDFIFETDMRASFVSMVLLNRNNLSPEIIYDELNKFKNNNPTNKFNNSTDWIGNNFIGSYLLFYQSLSRFCPIYSGFSTFCLLSSGNMRHLTELCYKTFLRASQENNNDDSVDVWTISMNHQSQAAKQASITFLNEIKNFGSLGSSLYVFTMRVGGIFQLAQLSKKQSEPERNHFSISGGKEHLEDKATKLLEEAVKWSVFFENKSTKVKNKQNVEIIDYVLNPIYAPYFIISYRKIRKLEFSANQINTLVNGSIDEYKLICRSLNSKWGDNIVVDTPNLFSGLNILE